MTMFGSQWLANPDTGYTIDQSIRFNKSASALMSRTFGTPTDRNKFTYAFWMKACSESNGYCLETNVSGTSGTSFSGMVMNGGSMQFFDYTGGSANIDVRTTFTSAIGKFRDYTAWYHAMFVYDSDQSTDSDRLKFFVNGRQFPVSDLNGPGGGSVEWPTSGENSRFNASGTVHRISSSVNGLVDGYMADIYFIDGQALTPSSFGEFSSTTGEFVPIEYSGAFGNNGFHIDGRDSSDLGDDESGNGNDFSTSNMGTDDQVPDSPTNNFCTLNPLEPAWGGAVTLSDGNLAVAGTAATVWNNAVATFKVPSTGKWIWAAEPSTSGGGQCDPWIVNETGLASRNNYVYVDANGWEASFDSSSVHLVLNNNSGTSASHAYGSGDFHVICFDADSKKLWFGVYDVSATTLKFRDGSTGFTGDPAAGTNQTFTLTGSEFTIGFASYTGRSGNVDFGQSDLLSQFTAPSGFNFLNTQNLPDPTIADPSAHFQTTLYTGNGSTQSITQSGNSTFQPDWVWGKGRSTAESHALFDAVRGTTKIIYSNLANAEATNSGVTAFNSDGFSIGSSASLNNNTHTYVAWQWKANGSGSSNSDGSVTSTVSNNSTANFSIVKYTGTGSGNSTVGHGLGTTPTFILLKHLGRSQNWRAFHTAEGVGETGFLNDSAAWAADPDRISAVSSTTFTAAANMNESADYIAYCFADVEGYSKFSSFSGNGSTDGPYVHLGFKPALLILKVSSNAPTGWIILDNKRDSFNAVNHVLQPNTSSAENTGADFWDFLSNGFKVRNTWAAANGSGYTVTFAAFAHSPFKTATAFGIES